MINAMRNFPSGLVRVCLFLIASVLILPSATLGRRAIPEDNLAYPVLLTFKNGATGSAFYLNTDDATYLVTPKHVLFDPDTKKLRDVSLEALSYSKDLADPGRNLLAVDLSLLNSQGLIKPHPTEDLLS
jgi:hypothetical protein